MNKEEVRQLCESRFASWTDYFVGEHALPVLVVSVGVGHSKGKTALGALKSISDEDYVALLRGAIDLIEQGILEAGRRVS